MNVDSMPAMGFKESCRLPNSRNSDLNPIHWAMSEKNLVNNLPYDVDGHNVFEIKCDPSEMMTVSKDGRPWGKWFTSSRKHLDGKRRVAKCRGSFKCENDKCDFLADRGTCNRIQFQTLNNITSCFTCGVPADRLPCPSIKIWEYDNTKKLLTVMHTGIEKLKGILRANRINLSTINFAA